MNIAIGIYDCSSIETGDFERLVSLPIQQRYTRQVEAPYKRTNGSDLADNIECLS